MTEFFEKMNEGYKQKNFPNGSIFGKVGKNVKRNGIIAIAIFFGPIFLASAYGCFWSLRRTLEMMAAGEDELGFGIGMSVFLGIVALLFLLIIIYFLKAGNKKAEDYITSSAKNSELPESEIRCFEQQVFASDCYILKLTAGLDRVLSNNTNKDGLLTRDYIYLADPRQTVIRIEDLKACCFEEYIYYVNNKRIRNLAIRLIASNGVTVRSDSTQEAGVALMEVLTGRNGAVDTNGGRVLQEGKQVDEYFKKVLGKK